MFQVRLKELREAAGFKSQQAFADAFGVAQSTVGGWESGKREPNYDTTIRLARFLNVSVDYLLGNDDYVLDPESCVEVGKNIVSAAESIGKPASEILLKYGILHEDVVAMTSGEYKFTLSTVMQLSDYLNVSTEYLLGRDLMGRLSADTSEGADARMQLFNSLSPEAQERVLDFMQYQADKEKRQD